MRGADCGSRRATFKTKNIQRFVVGQRRRSRVPLQPDRCAARMGEIVLKDDRRAARELGSGAG